MLVNVFEVVCMLHRLPRATKEWLKDFEDKYEPELEVVEVPLVACKKLEQELSRSGTFVKKLCICEYVNQDTSAVSGSNPALRGHICSMHYQ